MGSIEGGAVITRDLHISTQSDLNLLAGVRQVHGDLWISPDADESDPIRDLSPLRELNYVAGSLTLSDLGAISSLRWLSSVERIGHYLYLENLGHLRTLDGLEKLREVGRGVCVVANPLLESCAGLSGLRGELSCDLTITFNPRLPNLHGFEGITRLSAGGMSRGSLSVTNCTALESLSGLENLARVRQIDISSCPLLSDLGALEQLRRIDYQLHLARLPRLSSLDALHNLEYCPRFHFQDLPSLTTLTALRLECHVSLHLGNTGIVDLSSLPPTDRPVDLKLIKNPKLSSLAGLSDSTVIKLLWVDGDSALTRLDGLAGLPITIALAIRNCPLLTSLEGLEGVHALHADLGVSHNDALTSFEGLSALDSVGGGVYIFDNPALCDTLVDAFLTGVVVNGKTNVSGNADCSP